MALLVGGCPSDPAEFIAGGTGDTSRLATAASVQVLAPTTNLAINGGTPVETTWLAVATTNFASVEVVFDPDTTPNNDNEIVVLTNLPLTQSSALLDTTSLSAGTYFVGVLLRERNILTEFDYAPGRLVVNQATQLFFNSPRDNFVFDRTQAVAPRFDVDWEMFDPDSTLTVRVFLDPDSTPNGNEFLLRESTSQSGDSFSFNLPTANFAAGTYRVLALVSDGITETAFYAPGSIKLRSRLAGMVDLRNIDLATSPVQGAVFEGFNPRDNCGSFVSSCRDIDGDGFSEFIVMSQFGKPNYGFNSQRVGIGEAYLLYGRAARFSGAFSVNSTGRLFRGDVFTGAAEAINPIRPTRGISSFALLSDWDGDTVRDLAFGIPFTDSVTAQPMDSNGFFRTGGVVIAAGSVLRPDFNFPGGQVIRLDEITINRHGPQPQVLPPIHCPEGIFGPKSPQPLQGGNDTHWYRHRGAANAAVNDRMGCRISSNDPFDQFGETLSSYDFDGLIMSAPNRDPSVSTNSNGPGLVPGAGVVTVYLSPAVGGGYPWGNLQTPPANATFNYPGTPANSIGDTMPHDGPFLFIAHDNRVWPGPGGSQLGGDTFAAPGYVVDPDDALDPCTLDFSGAMPTGASCTILWSSTPGGRLSNVKGTDDINTDGLQDILIGQPLGASGAGNVYIVFGRLRGLMVGGELQLEELEAPMNGNPPNPPRIFDGVRIVGAPGDRLGQSQDRAGDFNGDGIPDVVIGSPLLNNRRGGVGVFFGSREVINLTQSEIPFTELPARGLGVIFVGDAEGDLAGARVSGVGDVDGDGNGDILIAAPNKSIRADLDLDGNLDIDRTECGVVYLIYGSPELKGTINLSDIGSEKLPGTVFVGRFSGDFLGAGIGEQGDRANGIAAAGDVDGDGLQDILISSVTASPRNRTAAGESYLIYGAGDQ